MHAIEAAVFADVSRPPDGGRGFDGVFARAADYWNPFEEALRAASRRWRSGDPHEPASSSRTATR